jgi:ring-1,2-phenylacetyl-CoA epoxidase subunit PaaE
MPTVPVAATNPTSKNVRNRPFYPLRVAAVERLCDDAAALTFDVSEGLAPDFDFLPGQALTVRRTTGGQEHRRSYSICAAIGEAPRIGVRAVPDGAVSHWLVNEVQAGDHIEVQLPSGTFTADAATPGNHVFIAAGSGVTPILSILTSVLKNPLSQALMLYGNRRTATIMFAEELADLKNAYGPRFELIHVLSQEPRGVDLFSGRLDTDRVRRLLHELASIGDVDHYWLCGPYGVVTGAGSALGDLGVAETRIHRELFFVGDSVAPRKISRETSHSPTSSDSHVTLIVDGSRSTLRLRRDIPILDGALQVRDDLPFACKGGVCGTCRAKVTTGTVDMQRNYALEKSEIAAGFVLTCQSLATSDELTVDFDA